LFAILSTVLLCSYSIRRIFEKKWPHKQYINTLLAPPLGGNLASEYLNNKTFESIIKSFQFYKRQRVKHQFIHEDIEQTYNRRILKYQDDSKKEHLEKTLKDYEESEASFKEYQDQLAYAFYVLSENIANWAKFNGIDMDDAVQEGVLICFEKIDRFDPRKGKAFNYMSTCILNHFRQLYRSARNYNELKKRYRGFLQERFDQIVIRNGIEQSNNARSGLESRSNMW
jgi:hypothetical protein